MGSWPSSHLMGLNNGLRYDKWNIEMKIIFKLKTFLIFLKVDKVGLELRLKLSMTLKKNVVEYFFSIRKMKLTFYYSTGWLNWNVDNIASWFIKYFRLDIPFRKLGLSEKLPFNFFEFTRNFLNGHNINLLG